MNEFDYTGNKIKNYFTAYLQKCIWWKRQNYLKKRKNIDNMENPLEDDLQMKYYTTIDEMVELRHKEEILLKECKGEYLRWNELSDQNLVAAILLLHEEEKKFIYQHVYEEKSFSEMEVLNRIPRERIRTVYYYAIRKICSWMGGGK